ncbi:hypothetical protein HK405_012366 [Cladochytrium tenue]|nr:hypothetical protein HK405_012366 [Cladochytrium tenue]
MGTTSTSVLAIVSGVVNVAVTALDVTIVYFGLTSNLLPPHTAATLLFGQWPANVAGIFTSSFAPSLLLLSETALAAARALAHTSSSSPIPLPPWPLVIAVRASLFGFYAAGFTARGPASRAVAAFYAASPPSTRSRLQSTRLPVPPSALS